MRANNLLNTSSIILLSVFILLLILFCCYQKKNYWRVQSWQKSLGLQHHLKIFQTVYQDVDGFALSRQARRKQDALDYIYGEIEFTSFIALLSLAKPNSNTVFYDLGCGAGKAVLACAMVYPIQKAVGVEILPELYTCASTQVQHLASLDEYKNRASTIQFILGDFLKVSLQEANFVFVNSSSLFGTTWENLCLVLNNLPQLETVITTSKPLISAVFTPQISTKIQMSWGIVPAYIHFRKTIIA